MDEGWFVGRLVEVPGVFSQGATLDELIENIEDAYDLVVTQDE
jgi:predicted RNase H-like HicB family nuclease